MKILHLSEWEARTRAPRASFREFLRVPSMSCGLYSIPKGAHDPQVPHTEDEVYYVVRGAGRIRAGEEDQAVRPGSVVYVPKGVAHHFHSITEDLALLVVFSPAERQPNQP